MEYSGTNSIMRFPGDTEPLLTLLKAQDDESIYYRFKVTLENSSGLLNTQENILTI